MIVRREMRERTVPLFTIWSGLGKLRLLDVVEFVLWLDEKLVKVGLGFILVEEKLGDELKAQ